MFGYRTTRGGILGITSAWHQLISLAVDHVYPLEEHVTISSSLRT